MPGYLLRPDDQPVCRPTVIVNNGQDGQHIAAYAMGAADAVARGYNALIFYGPGQGEMLFERQISFRPDWENVITPVVDYLLTRPEVDPARITLTGLSLGGELVIRAAAFEHRLAAVVAYPGFLSVWLSLQTQFAAAGWSRVEVMLALGACAALCVLALSFIALERCNVCGPEILTNTGKVIWFHRLPAGETATDFRAQTYQGKPVLTWLQGSGSHGETGYIYNDRYQQIATVRAGNGYATDPHEFLITPWNTALILADTTATANLTSMGGPSGTPQTTFPTATATCRCLAQRMSPGNGSTSTPSTSTPTGTC
ncbi:MAG: acetylxylan esterase [Streptosporangiaceae bacterium]